MSFANSTIIPGKKKINWEIIAHQDVNQISQNNDSLVLDSILPILLNSYINEEDFNLTDKTNLLKLLQLSQLSIEYLKYSVGTLDNLNTQILDENQNLEIKVAYIVIQWVFIKNQEETHKLKKNIKNLENLNKEYEIKKQAYYKYKQQLKSNPGYKCHLCDKVFFSNFIQKRFFNRKVIWNSIIYEDIQILLKIILIKMQYLRLNQLSQTANQNEIKQLLEIFKESKNSELQSHKKIAEFEKQIEIFKLEKEQQNEIQKLQQQINQLKEIQSKTQLELQKRPSINNNEKEEQHSQQQIHDYKIQKFTNQTENAIQMNKSNVKENIIKKLESSETNINEAENSLISLQKQSKIQNQQINSKDSIFKQINAQNENLKEIQQSKQIVNQSSSLQEVEDPDNRLQTIEEGNEQLQTDGSPNIKKSQYFKFETVQESKVNTLRKGMSQEERLAEFIRTTKSDENSDIFSFQKLNSKMSQPNGKKSFPESVEQINEDEKPHQQFGDQQQSKNAFIRKSNEAPSQSLPFQSRNQKQEAQDIVNYGSVQKMLPPQFQKQNTPKQNQRVNQKFDRVQAVGDSLLESYQESGNFVNIPEIQRQSYSGQDDDFEFSDDKDFFKQQSMQQAFKKQPTIDLVNKYK